LTIPTRFAACLKKSAKNSRIRDDREIFPDTDPWPAAAPETPTASRIPGSRSGTSAPKRAAKTPLRSHRPDRADNFLLADRKLAPDDFDNGGIATDPASVCITVRPSMLRRRFGFQHQRQATPHFRTSCPKRTAPRPVPDKISCAGQFSLLACPSLPNLSLS
jgi:hypothetical protein